MKQHAVVVIGASAGGVKALLTLSSTLPKNFPAPVLVVLHIGSHTSVLPALLAAQGNNPAVQATDGQRLENGTLFVAPPDRHMLVDHDTIRLSHGPKEHHTRPAIDPLFRSAARTVGARTIGVVLTGRLDDGTAGLQAIKDCGGLAVVQDPADAEFRDMPASALQAVAVDRCVPLARLATTLVELVGQPVTAETPRPLPHRPRLSLRSLDETQRGKTEDARWGAIRALEQHEGLLRALARQWRSRAAPRMRRAAQPKRSRWLLQAGRLQKPIETI